MNGLFSKSLQHGNKCIALAAVYLVTALLTFGCDSSRRLTASDTPVQYTKYACLAFEMNRDSALPFHLPIDAHEKLAQEGDPICQLSLGNRYEKGLGTPVDYAQARRWYSMLPYRDLQFGRMAREGAGQPVDLQQAKDYYQRAADQGYVSGNFALGQLLEHESTNDSDPKLKEVMAHYFKATKHYEDDPWKGIQRLLSRGVVLTAEQKNRYSEIWNRGFAVKLQVEIRYSKKLKELTRIAGTRDSMKVLCTFVNSGNTQDVKIIESSGTPDVDTFIIGLLQKIQMDPVLGMDTSDRYQFPIILKFTDVAGSQTTSE